MKWVEWIEPFGPNEEPVYLRVPATTAIAYQRASGRLAKSGFEYASDESALEDFVTVRWGRTFDQIELDNPPQVM